MTASKDKQKKMHNFGLSRNSKPLRSLILPFAVFLLFSLLSSLSPAHAGSVQRASSGKLKNGAAQELLEEGTRALKKGDFVQASDRLEALLSMQDSPGGASLKIEALIRLAQVRQMTGRYTHAIDLLSKAFGLAGEDGQKETIARIKGGLGNAHLGLGNETLASEHMLEGLTLALETGSGEIAGTILNNLGNLAARQGNLEKAEDRYRESIQVSEQAGARDVAASAAMNLAMVGLRNGMPDSTIKQLFDAVTWLEQTEDSQAKALGFVNAGLMYSELGQQYPAMKHQIIESAYKAYSKAEAIATRTADDRTRSFGLGYMGSLYEGEGRLQEGLALTRRAILAAQQQHVPEALYRWHWQSGRILDRQGELDEAIVSYRHSLRELLAIRQEMASCYSSPDSSYQKAASVISMEMVDLLLRRSSRCSPEEPVGPWLEEARDTLEAQKVYELRDYFKDDCIDAAHYEKKRLDTISSTIMVIYPIVFENRTELLLSSSNRLKRVTLPIGEQALTEEILNFRRKLVKRTTWEFLPHAQTLYDWLIRPLESDLKEMQPETLVFVPGGALRTIPMSALHDGDTFLISRYRIAVTPSINLTDPRPYPRKEAKILSLGLTEPVQGFPGLPYVGEELQGIMRLYEGVVLLNEKFQTDALEELLKTEPYNMVHIASHGHFGGDVHDSFILAYDEQFTMEQIGKYVGLLRFRDEPLDMLTLSACETAAGNERAALGLAGVAVRAGARSALATLWHVNDPATQELILEFYRQLKNPAGSRASALQAAQLKMAEDPLYDHPGYWAPFILINDWQ